MAKTKQGKAEQPPAHLPDPLDPLDAYRARRDFGISAEPGGRQRGREAEAPALSFVVQRHAARRLHYDFRLELDGTLKSWAVPKGPSLDPADKRMAVQVEDHPLAYAGFEGVIPEKQYGAGTVIVWDRGLWIPLGDPVAGYRDGKLKFELRGRKLQGHWTLVRMHGRQDERQPPWLLIKERDAFARPAAEYDITAALPDSVLSGAMAAPAAGRSTARPATAGRSGSSERAGRSLPGGASPAALPLTLAPQLATFATAAPRGRRWSYEIKFDGYRILARIDGAQVHLFTRNGHDWTSRLKGLASQIAGLGLDSAWLDGEIVMLDPRGATDFQALQNAFESAHVEAIQYFLFDIPYCQWHDLRAVPLAERRDVLRRLLDGTKAGSLHFSESFDAEPGELLDAACRLGLEGVIGKRADAPYVSARTESWIKLKCTQGQAFVIGGFTDPKGGRHGFGSLLLGVHDEQGRLAYAGNVGSGFDERTLADLGARLGKLRTDACPFGRPPALKAHWVEPRLVAEVSFADWTRERRVRQAVYHGLRSDKPPQSVTVEKAVAVVPESRPARRKTVVSHADRVIDPATGLTKGDLVRFYEGIASWLLPHLRGRPVSLVRAPAGIQGELFFQKHADTLRIPGIRLLDPALWPGHPALLEIDGEAAIAAAAQLNVVEFHTWNATRRSIGKPDRLVFDLDPGEGVPWQHVLDAAALTKTMLDELGLQGFLKTSGGKGLHVVVPIAPRLPWEDVKAFARSVVIHMAGTIPQRFVSRSGPRNRVGKIFVDYLRNGRGATTVSAFSARARPGLGVSMPVSWDELGELKAGNQWTILSAPARAEAFSRADPWAGYPRVRAGQRLAAAIRMLGA
ncbi:DNA ligase D [Cupriavidus basilensis]|uniref:DNA ligase (ATP) n=1 Tax=Cupriavidus basilensis TaxID=68895 RepID=A0ABT6ARM7_9BURK|nr:DNA ligase D [Cupriavidus basilensis]MDF3835048.1 DNA ligase D [Cupriavidus basilensis]